MPDIQTTPYPKSAELPDDVTTERYNKTAGIIPNSGQECVLRGTETQDQDFGQFKATVWSYLRGALAAVQLSSCLLL